MDTAFQLLSKPLQAAVCDMGWTSLRPIQEKSIPLVISDKRDIIICAQTASGKTEAAFLPILSEVTKNPSTQVIYIAPLKALINDQFVRMEALCEKLGINVHRWHGDVPHPAKVKFRENPSGVLLITPESMESNFLNHSGKIVFMYRNLEYIVIDELHSFLNDVRGLHLRSLIARLRACVKKDFRFVGLSATLGNPDEGRRFLRPAEPQRVVVVEDRAQSRSVSISLKPYLQRPRVKNDQGPKPKRVTASTARTIAENVIGGYWLERHPLEAADVAQTILSHGADREGDESFDIAHEIAKNFRSGTNLIFVNSRTTAEKTADALAWIARHESWIHNPFLLHHSSITREVRQDVETKLKRGEEITAVCTSTLELGIDVGNIKTVGQIDAPWAVSSLMQRLGRSGRREGESAVLRMYSRDSSPHEKSTLTELLYPGLIRGIAVVELALKKWVEPSGRERIHASTFIHQVLSLLRETGGLTAQSIWEALCKTGPFNKIDAKLFKAIMLSLGQASVIEQAPDGTLILASKGEVIANNRNFYAAFDAVDNYKVVLKTEEVVGFLPADSIPPDGETFLLSGRRWLVLATDHDKKEIQVKPSELASEPLFVGGEVVVHDRVIATMREVLLGDNTPTYLNEEGRHLLAAARYAAKSSGAAKTCVIFSENHTQWFPWSGTLCHRTLMTLAHKSGYQTEGDYLSVTLNCSHHDFVEWLRWIHEGDWTDKELAALLPVRKYERFDDLLSNDILDYVNARDRLDIVGAKRVAGEALCAIKSAHKDEKQ